MKGLDKYLTQPTEDSGFEITLEYISEDVLTEKLYAEYGGWLENLYDEIDVNLSYEERAIHLMERLSNRLNRPDLLIKPLPVPNVGDKYVWHTLGFGKLTYVVLTSFPEQHKINVRLTSEDESRIPANVLRTYKYRSVSKPVFFRTYSKA